MATTTANPPGDIAAGAKGIKLERGGWQEVAIYPYSDGDPRHWPGKPAYLPANEANHRIKVAAEWMREQGRGEPSMCLRFLLPLCLSLH